MYKCFCVCVSIISNSIVLQILCVCVRCLEIYYGFVQPYKYWLIMIMSIVYDAIQQNAEYNDHGILL